MANTKVPIELSSTPGIVDNSTATAITIDSTGAATFSGTVTADGLDVSTLSGDATIYLQNVASARGMKITKNYDDFSAKFFYSNHPSTEAGTLAFKGAQDSTQLLINSNGDVSFYEDTGTTAKMVWDASGEILGIGGSPNAALPATGTLLQLQRTGSSRLNITASNVSYSAIDFGDADDLDVGKIEYYHANNTMYFSTNAANRMVIDASGNVGIGAVAPQTNLEIVKVVAGDVGLLVRNANNSTGDSATLTLSAGSAYSRGSYVKSILTSSGGTAAALTFGTNTAYNTATERMRIDASGNLLVGTTAQILSGLQCNQFNGSTHNGLILKTTRTALNSTFAAFANSAGASCGAISQNGTATVLYGASSDRRLKENISDSDDSGLVIDAIQVRKFDWIGTDEHERYGFIAQELQEVVPVAVCSMGMPDEEDPMLGVDPSKLMALAIKEIQSLRARIAILEGA